MFKEKRVDKNSMSPAFESSGINWGSGESVLVLLRLVENNPVAPVDKQVVTRTTGTFALLPRRVQARFSTSPCWIPRFLVLARSTRTITKYSHECLAPSNYFNQRRKTVAMAFGDTKLIKIVPRCKQLALTIHPPTVILCPSMYDV
ncbi:uncharacterized protein LOC143213067 [Lasioglossum baleicum]|uniref:uncharacterized protein LOC143213067 n=1 Tax=Lasioglossum baleicum TaxID=434251 RepID=UPI003FCD662D